MHLNSKLLAVAMATLLAGTAGVVHAAVVLDFEGSSGSADPGGTGIAEELRRRHELILEMCAQRARECVCERGCPACGAAALVIPAQAGIQQ